LTFQLYAYRFVFRAIDPVHFPRGSAANAFRGAFGHVFRCIACRPDCPGARTCAFREQCSYARLFEPACLDGPSGLADAPRPFVIRAEAIDGHGYTPGESFSIGIHVFDRERAPLEYFESAFAALAAEGVGAERGRVSLSAAETECVCHVLSLDPQPCAPKEIAVRFVTPIELKHEGRIARDIPFSLLFARSRDRISTLSSLYGEGPLELDFRAMGQHAAAVITVASALRHEGRERRSSRTGQTHSIGGLVGEVRYAGELGEFLPFLEAARWTGIGRQTTWGKGAIEVSYQPDQTAAG
jgi:hypothetical protein